MIKRLLVLTISIVTALTLVVIGGCSCKNNKEDPIETALTGVHTLNGFNTLDELYDIKWVNMEYSTTGKMEINTDATYIKEGAGSLSHQIEKHVWPELYIEIKNTAVPEMNVADIKNISVWIFNNGEESVKATLNVCQADVSHLLSQEFELPAKEWTECVMSVNAVVTKYAKDNVTGFSVQFMTETPQQFYIDDLRVEFGAVFSEEDNKNVAMIEEIIADIDAMPTNITAEHEEQISTIYNKYNSLSDIYKSAVSNYAKMQTAMRDLAAARNSAENKKQTASTDRPAYYFDRFYGMTHLSTAHGTKVNFAYSTDVKFGEESGSTVIKFLGDVWNYIDFSNTINLADYDYVEFSLYNDGQEKAVWLNNKTLGWSNRTQVKTNEWVTLQIPVTALNDSGAQFIITTSVNSGTASITDGNMYISAMRAIKLAEKNMYVSALKEQNPIVSDKATYTVTNGKINLVATANGDVDLALNKQIESVSVAQNVMFALNISKATSIQLIDGSGAVLKGAIAVSEGWNTVVLTPKQYNQTSKLRISAETNEEFILSNMYAVRDTDVQGMKLILEKDYLPELSAWTVNDLPKALEYMLIFNDAQILNLKKQFVKVTAGADSTLNAKQEAEYLAITKELTDRAAKIKSLTEQFIDAVDLNDNDVESRYMMNEVYGKYTQSKLLTALSGEDTTKVMEIIAQLEYLPYRLIDVSNSAERSKITIDARYYPWSGKIVATTDGVLGTVMGVTATEFRKTDKNDSHNNLSLIYDTKGLSLDYDYINFKVYSPDKGRKLYFTTVGWGKTIKSFDLQPNQWNDVYISVSDYQSSGYMLFTNVDLNSTIKFGDFFAYNEKYVQKQIDNLPDANTVALADRTTIESVRADYNRLSAGFRGKVTGLNKLESCEAKIVSLLIDSLPTTADLSVTDYSKIKGTRLKYNDLSATAKQLVTNLATLTALEDAFETKFVIVDQMTDKTNYTVHHDGYGNRDCTTLSTSSDNVIGNYLSAYISGATHEHLAIKYNIADLENKLSSCATVSFFVYNGNTSNKNFMCNFGGSLIPNYKTLLAGEWTKIEVSVADFISGTYFGIYGVNTGADPCEYKFSIIGGETDGNKVQPLVDMINALPSVSSLSGLDYAKITAARSNYDALSATSKTAVTNYADLQALETAYAEKFVMIEDMDGSSMFSFNTSYTTTQATLSYGDDAEYGEYMNVHYIASSGTFTHGVVKMEFSNIDLSGCDKVCLYVYNGGTANRNLLTNIGGSLVTNYATLVAGEWTLVEFNAADFVTGKYMGIYSAQADTDYKFSAIFATKTNG
ncbi:MAG: hypothetical protein IJD54_02275 [Clostridia bacterium]|nr:hypothetical protein [Clostridia bacterium]